MRMLAPRFLCHSPESQALVPQPDSASLEPTSVSWQGAGQAQEEDVQRQQGSLDFVALASGKP